VPVSKRTYNSDNRRQQAAETRLRILRAAQARFERDGYVPTTMAAIAGDAGVALKTVYVACSTKSALLRAVWDLLLKGDLDDAPVGERPWYREVLDEPDPVRQLELTAHGSRLAKERIGGLLRVIRDAAVVDGDAAELWELIQSDFLENQRVIVESIASHGGLRGDLDVARATDVLWTLNHPNVWLLLVGERGWTTTQFEAWFREACCDQLLDRR
jgi:AcrR family transcriptional regulator